MDESVYHRLNRLEKDKDYQKNQIAKYKTPESEYETIDSFGSFTHRRRWEQRVNSDEYYLERLIAEREAIWAAGCPFEGDMAQELFDSQFNPHPVIDEQYLYHFGTLDDRDYEHVAHLTRKIGKPITINTIKKRK